MKPRCKFLLREGDEYVFERVVPAELGQVWTYSHVRILVSDFW